MGAITLIKEKVAIEDMELGVSTTTQLRGTVTQINGGLIPYDGSNSLNAEIDTKDTITSVDTKIATREPLGGDTSTTFKAADGVASDDVTNKGQLDEVDNRKYDKPDTDTLLADKANNSNTMLLDGTTPSPDYSIVTREVPANKGYVLDTVQNIGAGDMTRAVYDTNANGRVDTADGLGIASDTMGVTPYTQFLRLSQGTVLDANTIVHFGIFVGVDIANSPSSGLVGIEQMDMELALNVLGIQTTGGKAQRAFSFSTFKWYTRIYDTGSDTWSQWLVGADETDVADLQEQITTNDADVADLQEQITTNDADIATKVSKTGDTMTGQLKTIAPIDGEDAVNKEYVDAQDALKEDSLGLGTAGQVLATNAAADGKEWIDVTISFPAGTLVEGLYTTPPSGFMAMNGQAVKQADYPELFAVIGTQYDTFDGATPPASDEFRIPKQSVDGLGLFHRGVGATNGAVGTYQADVFKSHVHGDSSTAYGAGSWGNSGSQYHDGDSLATGDATETRPRSLTVLKCISAGREVKSGDEV